MTAEPADSHAAFITGTAKINLRIWQSNSALQGAKRHNAINGSWSNHMPCWPAVQDGANNSYKNSKGLQGKRGSCIILTFVLVSFLNKQFKIEYFLMISQY